MARCGRNFALSRRRNDVSVYQDNKSTCARTYDFMLVQKSKEPCSMDWAQQTVTFARIMVKQKYKKAKGFCFLMTVSTSRKSYETSQNHDIRSWLAIDRIHTNSFWGGMLLVISILIGFDLSTRTHVIPFLGERHVKSPETTRSLRWSWYEQHFILYSIAYPIIVNDQLSSGSKIISYKLQSMIFLG